MIHLDLNGLWTLREAGSDNESLPATVPGCVHTDLLAVGNIPDPWYRDNEKEIHWVAHRDWIYEHSFTVDDTILDRQYTVLRFEGLDTFCTVELNGVTVLEADNMHRTWEADVKTHLLKGDNSLRLTFKSPIPYMKQRDAEKRLWGWNVFHEDYWGRSYVRKMACAFGWDWGLMAPTAGIWRPATLMAYDARIDEVKLTQQHNDAEVLIDCKAGVEGEGSVRFSLRRNGNTVASVDATERVPPGSASGTTDFFASTLTIENPELWWPNGMGDQPLYELLTELVDPAGCVMDSTTQRIGLRICELVREADEFGESFKFRVNGRDVFMKGGNWIPCDVFPSNISDATYRHLLQSCADSHMNMIRVWGGGIYEDDRFYNLCDELGLLVWQDFMFACSTYPTFDDTFMASVREEAIDNVRRIRHHPCLALWCGNNELEQGLVQWDIDDWTDRAMPPKDYLKLFDKLLPEITAKEDPATPYWPSSGHTPGQGRDNSRDDTRGDAHSWSVWFGGQPFEAQRDWKFRFMSEFGFQSFPEPRTVEAFTEPEDRHLNSWVMDYHQRSKPGNGTIFRYLFDWFLPPKSLEDTLWMTQISQALCVQYAAENARRIQGRMDGLLYWQINDLWPGATWSSIDVHGRWKALQFFAKRFFAPVLVSILESVDDETVEFHLSNHLPDETNGTLRWEISTCDGTVIREGKQPVTVASQFNERVLILDVSDLRSNSPTLPLEIRNNNSIPRVADRDILIWAWFEQDGIELSRNLGFLAKPKYLKLQQPTVTVEVDSINGQTVDLILRTDRPAPWTQLELVGIEGAFSDNFIHLHPRWDARLQVTLTEPVGEDRLYTTLRITPLLNRSIITEVP